MQIEISSGLILDATNLNLSALTVEDVAFSLNHLCRFNGHCQHFFSVLSHSVNCAIAGTYLGYDMENVRYCFAHDFSEIVLGDLPSPMRPLVPDFCALEKKIDDIFLKRFDISGDYDKMKAVDSTMAKIEASFLMTSRGNSPRYENKVDLYGCIGRLYGLQNKAATIDIFLHFCDALDIL